MRDAPYKTRNFDRRSWEAITPEAREPLKTETSLFSARARRHPHDDALWFDAHIKIEKMG